MQCFNHWHCAEWVWGKISLVVAWVIFALMISSTVPSVQAAGTVTSCTEASLRAAMAGGGTVTFACDGIITLGNTISNFSDIVLDSTGHQITISGGNTVRVFYVATNVALTLTNLTIANGAATNGAGVFNDGGMVTFENCRFLSNAVCGVAGTDVSYTPDAGGAFGGAVFNTGVLRAHNCVFSLNSACGGNGGDNSQMIPWPDMMPVPGGAGGHAHGGAICNWGQATIACSLFVSNSAVGGTGGGGKGGWVSGDIPYDGGTGGDGGDGDGGGIFNGGTISLVNCTLALNSGIGGGGGNGGGAGIFWHYGVLIHGEGGVGGAGGDGFGGIGSSNAPCLCANCTVAYNIGAGGTNGLSSPYWCSVGSGDCPPPSFPPRLAAGGIGLSGALAVNSIFAFNKPSNGCGTLTDAGHDLSSDGSCIFTGIGSLNNTDPKLGPLADNGGATLTMALLPGSPAIDAGSAVGAPATDQRGVARPQGPGVDVGAFEYQYVPVFTGAKFQSATEFWLQMSGLLPTQTFTLQTSTNLLHWVDVTNFTAGDSGICEFIDKVAVAWGTRFYRLKPSTP